ncbi:SRPBCC family protein [Williamsia soli]|uniref:SRPBCC family protein n=1 Tax=Williamsia soli TaxID=364929 RepID=UPI001F1C5A06|nr:SRPBCC family protein [Williamsia soli]
MAMAPRRMQTSDSIDIAASAQALYSMISDPTRMGEWSPENLGATVVNPKPDGEAFVGMVFEGTNRRGRARWVTRCTVTAADSAERFAFRVHAIGRKAPKLKGANASWEYRFEANDSGGTTVTETWFDDRRRWPRAVVEIFDRVVTSGTTFPEFQEKNIARTLQALKSAAEAS